ncbi:MAG: HAD-IC family P-type ATPase, partial [Bacteroidetes bacterium]|nr:HAD-IC family P-type ATPase [Bacteroidota bacterium]
QTVYGILSKNNLCDYYGFEENPGNELGNEVVSDEYAYLDEPDIAKDLLDYKDEQQARVRLHLPQIHCASCIWLLENLHKLNKGIIQSRVNFSKKEISISYNPSEVSLRKVVELLATFGYRPTINLDCDNQKVKKTESRKIYYQLGVAGFFFGNIMLTSFPEYFGLSGEWFTQFGSFFRWFNLICIIPVVTYSAQDYWQNALSALQTRIINLDVPIAIGIFALLGRSVYEVVSTTGPGYFDSLAGFIFFLTLGKLFQSRTYSALSFDKNFKAFFPLSTTKLENGLEKTVKVTDLQVGDTIKVKSNEIIPVDAALLSNDAHIDFSFVTGESAPVKKHQNDFIYAGGRQVGSAIELAVSKTVEESYLADLWRKDTEAQENKLGTIANQVGKYFTYAVLTIATFVLTYWLFADASKAFPAFTSVLIVACPCALALSIPFTYGTAMRVLSRNGFFVKDSQLLDVLAQVRSIVFDKTGTLTESQSRTAHYIGRELTNAELSGLAAICAQSAHPVSQTILKSIKHQTNSTSVEGFTEFTGLGIEADVNGRKFQLGKAQWLTNEDIKGTVLIIDNQYAGHFEIEHAYRKGVFGTISQLASQFKLFLLSGDNNAEKGKFAEHFGNEHVLLFNQQPHEKLEFVQSRKADGELTSYIGDGLNDAGALAESSFGISVTDDTNNFTPASSAIILGKELNKLPTILAYVQKARRVVFWAFALSFAYNLIGMSFAVQAKLSPVVSAILMPLSSITVVAFVSIACLLIARKMKLI